MLYAEDRRVSNRPTTPAPGVRPGALMSTADRAALARRYDSAPKPKPVKRLDAPVTKTFDNRNFLAKAYDALLNTAGNPLSNPVNTGRGVSMGGQGNAAELMVEPARVAARRAVGDFTAIPGVGEPSESPTATDIKKGNYLGPALDYLNLALITAPSGVKGVRVGKDIANARTMRSIDRQLNPFPKTQTPNSFIDQAPRQAQPIQTPAARQLGAGPSKNELEQQLLDNYLTAQSRYVRPTQPSAEIREALESYLTQYGQSGSRLDDLLQQGAQNRQAIAGMSPNPYAPEASISLNSSDLADVLDSGQYGSMFGAGASKRSEGYDTFRLGNEAALYGLDENSLRPIYGFLRQPGDPYTAAGYGKQVSGINSNDPFGSVVTADDNFVINVAPQKPMTSAPADSFRVESPLDVKPLTSKDTPSFKTYREIQIWADSIKKSDIKSAELIFAEPRALFRTLIADTENPIKATLQTYIQKIDALLGTGKGSLLSETRRSGALQKLEENSIPTTITVRRDFGLSPRATGSENVRQTLSELRAEAENYLLYIDKFGEAPVKDYVLQQVGGLFADPKQNYMAQLVQKGQAERAGRVYAETGAGPNANPFYPGQRTFNEAQMVMGQIDSVEDMKGFIRGGNSGQYLLQQYPDLAEYALLVAKNDVKGAANLIKQKYTDNQIVKTFTDSNVGDVQGANFRELDIVVNRFKYSRDIARQINSLVFESLPTDLKQIILEHYKSMNSML